MLLTELFIFTVSVLLGVGGYHLGRRDGYDRGYFDGDQHRLRSMLPQGHVRVVESHEKAGT